MSVKAIIFMSFKKIININNSHLCACMSIDEKNKFFL